MSRIQQGIQVGRSQQTIHLLFLTELHIRAPSRNKHQPAPLPEVNIYSRFGSFDEDDLLTRILLAFFCPSRPDSHKVSFSQLSASPWPPKMIWHISSVAFLCFSTFAGALPPYPAPPAATITLPPHSGHPANISQLLADRIYNPGLEKRQSGVIGTGICASAMNGFTCDSSRHEENRCAGDQYSYCICAGSASMPGRDPQGLWL